MSLPEIVCAGLESALNRYLELDPAVVESLARLHGRVIAFELVGVGEKLYLVPGQGRLQVLAEYEGETDCLLRGTPLALTRMGDHRASSAQLFSGEVEISGDTELAHSFGKIIASMDVDWEEQLSRVTGDIIAHELGNLWRGARRWSRDSSRSLGMDIQEFLQEELRLLPLRTEIDAFLADVDSIRDDAERLQARFERLQGKMPNSGSSSG